MPEVDVLVFLAERGTPVPGNILLLRGFAKAGLTYVALHKARCLNVRCYDWCDTVPCPETKSWELASQLHAMPCLSEGASIHRQFGAIEIAPIRPE